jgi:hypothetical protein
MPLEESWHQQQEKCDQEQEEPWIQNQNPEWSQLRKMEEYLKQQREKLQRQEASYHHGSEHWHQQIKDNDLPWHNDWDESEPEEEPEEADMEFITYVLDSLTKMPALHLPGEFSGSNESSNPDN